MSLAEDLVLYRNIGYLLILLKREDPMNKRRPALITSLAEAERHIRQYGRELRNSAKMQRRVANHRSWYALRSGPNPWIFAPSKFVGYRYASAAEYLGESGQDGDRDGTQTERLLMEWFHPVDRETPLGRELNDALREFLADFGKPNKMARVNLTKDELETVFARKESPGINDNAISDRISFDPRICGGRPCIKGTRMRVADIVAMLADGATKAEILQDFDYLTEADIDAALRYAAGAADHPVIRTA